jgi:cystathionine gamma-synthase
VTDHKTATSTDAVHAGDPRDKPYDAVPHAVVQTATYTFADTAEVVAYTDGTHARPDREEYGRYGNPTVRAVETRLAALEGTEDALLFASGMAAITTAAFALVKSGQHVVLFRDCYRMTLELVTTLLPKLGVAHTLLEPGDVAGLGAAIRPETRLVLSESPTNPHLVCADLARLAEACRAHRGCKSLVDATFATPVNCRPASFGVDLVVHSATKYLNGHSDIVAGAVVGREALVKAAKHKLDHLGATLDPHACFLLDRGMKTMALRVRHQNESTLALTRFLEKHHAVSRVHYPGLESHRRHARAKEWFRGCGGLFSFELAGGLAAADRLFSRLTLPAIAPSLGGVETLVTRPATTSHAGLTAAHRRELGIGDGLVRVSVGIEATEDLVADFGGALGS